MFVRVTRRLSKRFEVLKKLFTTTVLHNTDNDSAEVSLFTPSICGVQTKREHNGQFANRLLLVFVAIWAKKVFGTSWEEEELYKTVCVSPTHQRKVPQGTKHLVDTSQFSYQGILF